MTGGKQIELGIRANLAQFSLLVLVNAFVGAMVGMERSILPSIAEQEFHLAARAAILSFIVVFGVTKALTNYLAGRLSDAYGRKVILVSGWLIASPVPFLLMWAPSWTWVLVANVLLGVSQGLTWSTTVIMKIDLAGPAKRGLAMGLNEFAGYLAVALSALATGYIASTYGLRPQPFYLGIGFVAFGLLLSALLVRETKHHVHHEAKLDGGLPPGGIPSQRDVFAQTSLLDRNLSSVSQAGLVNNLNDGMAWGLFPLFFAASGMSLAQIGWLAAIYPGVWGMGQLVTGALSDKIGTEVAHRRWNVDAGDRDRRHGGLEDLRGVRDRRRPPRSRHRHGLSDVARRHRGRGSPDVASVCRRRVPALAGSRVCDRRAAGRCRGRCPRRGRRHLVHRRAHVRLRARRSRSHARDTASTTDDGRSVARPHPDASRWTIWTRASRRRSPCSSWTCARPRSSPPATSRARRTSRCRRSKRTPAPSRATPSSSRSAARAAGGPTALPSSFVDADSRTRSRSAAERTPG